MNRYNRFITAMGGRRYLLVLFCAAAATVLQWFGKLDAAGSTYALIIGFTVGAYITGNTAQKIKAAPVPEHPE